MMSHLYETGHTHFDPLKVESTQKRLTFFSRKASFFDRTKILTKLNDINRARHIKA